MKTTDSDTSGEGTGLIAILAGNTPVAADPLVRVSAILKAKSEINPRDPLSVLHWGDDVYDTVSRFNDNVGSKTSEAGDVGKLIDDVLLKAKDIDISRLKGGGLLSRLMSQGSGEIARFRGRFETAEGKIGEIVRELLARAGQIDSSARNMDALYEGNRAQFEKLEIRIAAGHDLLLEARTVTLPPLQEAAESGSSPFAVQELARFQGFIDRLDRKVISFEALRQDTIDKAMEILVMQENSLDVIEVIHDAVNVTKQWKKQFRIALNLEEQNRAVEMSARIHDANNAMRRKTSEMLGQVVTATARQAERPAIDISTLEAAQAAMFAALDAKARIIEQGRVDRVEGRRKLAVLESNVRQRLSPT